MEVKKETPKKVKTEKKETPKKKQKEEEKSDETESKLKEEPKKKTFDIFGTLIHYFHVISLRYSS